MLILQLTQLLTGMQYFLVTGCYSDFTHVMACMTKQGVTFIVEINSRNPILNRTLKHTAKNVRPINIAWLEMPAI